jgi:hypothetical protein
MSHRHNHDNVERQILREVRETHRELEEIERLLRPARLSQSSALQFLGDTTMPNNALTLAVGQASTASPITFLADGVTPSGATYSAATYTFSDPSATVVLNPDGVTATVTGIAASTGPISGSVAFTATDTDGVVSTWTQAFTVTTTAAVVPPPPTQLSQSAAVTFTTPA